MPTIYTRRDKRMQWTLKSAALNAVYLPPQDVHGDKIRDPIKPLWHAGPQRTDRDGHRRTGHSRGRSFTTLRPIYLTMQTWQTKFKEKQEF